MTRFSLGIPTAAVLIGLTVSATAQTAPQTQVPVENAVTAPATQDQATSAAPAVAAPAAPATPAVAAPAVGAVVEAPAGTGPAAVTSEAGPTATSPAQSAAPQVEAAPTAPASSAEVAPVTPAAAPSTETSVQGQSPNAPAEAAALPGQEPAAAEPAPVLPAAHDMSPMGMYHQADFVVKAVMILLAVASFLSWTVLFYKLVETAVARSRARKAATTLNRSASLASAVNELKGRSDPAAFMVQAVAEEYRRSADAIAPSGAEGVKERAASLVQRVEVQASARLRRGMGLLATIGSVAPFVGLFGTVWGIMNSFIGIAETQTTNLAVVAPGIAEALFATAIGLVAAIPAVVIYNHFTRVIQGYKQTLGDAGAATLRLLSRDIDFRNLEG